MSSKNRYGSKYLRIFHHFFTISRYRSKYLRIFPSLFHNKSVPFKIFTYFFIIFFHNKSVPFKKSTDLPSFFFPQRMWFSFLIYITDMSYFVVYSIKMIDSSDYTVEYRVHAASFFIASEQTRHAMKLVRDSLRVQFDVEPPEHRIIKTWSTKLLETGSLFDRPRGGRPTKQKMKSLMWRKMPKMNEEAIQRT